MLGLMVRIKRVREVWRVFHWAPLMLQENDRAEWKGMEF